MLIALAACVGALSAADSDTSAAPPSAPMVFHGATVVGQGLFTVTVDKGSITSLSSPDEPRPEGAAHDVSGRYIVPAFIDSHVHLAYLPAVDEMARGGVAGVVDLAAPLAFLAESHQPLRLLASGPMVTAVGGYPTTSWGRDGYGLECADATAAAAAVEALHAAGAAVIKLPVTGGAQLGAAALAAATSRAHQAGLPVVSHALDDDQAARAAAAAVDVLAHSPTSPLSPGTISAWSGRAVISTLSAFGGSITAVENLRALRGAGATVLYGTDFGNTRTAGIDAAEIALLAAAGLSPAEILGAGTSAPAAYWGFTTLGAVMPGRDASFLVLDRDPLLDASVLATPSQVWIRGVRRR